MRFIPFILLALLITVAARADEITLKSGKVIAGKITAETKQSYTIRFGSNMFLSVAKNEVASVSRIKAEAPRPTLTLQQAMASTSTVVSSTPVAATSPAVRPAAPKNASVKVAAPKPVVRSEREGINTETLKIGVARIERTTRFRTHDIYGRDFDSVKGALDGQGRRPSKTEWDASWSGVPGPGGKQWKSVVVVATVTVTLPGWKNIAQAPAGEAEKWSVFLKAATDHEGGHLGIIHDALMSFGESASNLTDPGEKELNAETHSLFRAIRDQAAKRRQGYERRESRPTPPIRKKQ